MGSSQSTRKITVPNESAHIIKVSDSVIERLKNVDNANSAQGVPANQPVRPTIAANPVPTYAPSYEGSLTSLKVLQEKERQLKENDAYWATRVSNLENAQQNADRIREQEFVKAVAAIENKLPQIPKRLSEAPCADKKSKVLECYKNNPKQILLCAKEVAEFAECVDRKRLATA